MANLEESGILKRKDSSGNVNSIYPVTKTEYVEGLEEALVSHGLPFNVEILETICENIELTKNANTYTFATPITLDADALYYLSYAYSNNGVSDESNSGYVFSRVTQIDEASVVRWLTYAADNSVTMSSTNIVDTWCGANATATISIYKVKHSVIDQLKNAANIHEGYATVPSGKQSHAEGNSTTANGSSSHAEGYGTTANGDNSHAEGVGTTAEGLATHVEGAYNIAQTSVSDNYERAPFIHIVGNGTSKSARSNAHTLDWSGNAWFAGTVEGTGLILKSSASGSSKRLKITVDDDGTLTVNGLTDSAVSRDIADKSYVESAIQAAIQNTWEASY